MKYINDTIAAVATAPGNADKQRNTMESHRMMYGFLMDGTETVDECMAVFMRAPKSYTKEDVAEIQLHGGSYLINRAMEICIREGARLAEAGEFTRRAILNGRIDLSRAEAVMALISARGEQEHRAAIKQLKGGASTFIRSFADELYKLQAGLAACIDYPEEISDEEGTGALKEGLKYLISHMEESIDEHSSKLIYQGLKVALIGRPNVGKSSILNALLNEDRAIVTDIPGTTRDTIQGEIYLNGIRVILTDTAGIHETEDPVEKIGVERSEKARRNADLTLLILDGSETLSDVDHKLLAEFAGEGAIVINKSDLPRKVTEEMIRRITPGMACVSVSAKENGDVSSLKDLIEKHIIISDRLSLTQPRHLDAVRRAVAHLKDALETLDNYPADMASTDLQAAQKALGEITGDNADEKLLDSIFSMFCVGK